MIHIVFPSVNTICAVDYNNTKGIIPDMNTETSWIKKVKQRMLELNINVEQMAQLMDMTPGGVRHYLNGNREPSLEQLLQLLTILDLQNCSVLEILGGNQEKLRATKYPKPLVAKCPVLSWKEGAAWPENQVDLLKGKLVQLSDKLVLSPTSYALQVKDDTMESVAGISFSKGSHIIIDPKVEYKPSNFIVAKKDGRDTLMFRLYELDHNDNEMLTIINTKHKSRSIDLTSDIKITGVVVAHLDVLV